MLIGVAPLLAGLLAPVWGRLADRYGQKGIAVKALLAYVVILALSAAVTSVGQLLALRIGIGLFGGIGPLGLAMATAQAPREETGRAVGRIQAAQILSAAIGPLAGGLLADTIGIRRTFLVTAALCALALVLVLVFYEERGPAEAGRGPGPGFRAVVALPGVVALLVVLFLVNFIGRSFTPILPAAPRRPGRPRLAPRLATGVLISAYSLAAAPSAWPGPAEPHAPAAGSAAATLVGGAPMVPPMASFRLGCLGLAVLLGLVSGGSLTLCYTIGGLLVPEDSHDGLRLLLRRGAVRGRPLAHRRGPARPPRCAVSTTWTRRSTSPWPGPRPRGRPAPPDAADARSS